MPLSLTENYIFHLFTRLEIQHLISFNICHRVDIQQIEKDEKIPCLLKGKREREKKSEIARRKCELGSSKVISNLVTH